ncbi:hypothetical protein ABK040_011962 [Willaertia magna]
MYYKTKLSSSGIAFLSSLLFFILLCYQHIQPIYSGCVMTSNGYKNQSFFDYNYPTIPWTQPYALSYSQNELLSLCPNLNPNYVCCNDSQVEMLKINFKKLDLTFWHCPACVLNNKKFWCDFTCSPEQDQYVTIRDMNPKDKRFISAVNFFISEQFQKDFWSSCKDDKFGQQAVKDMFPDVGSFLQGLIDKATPNPWIKFQLQQPNNQILHSIDFIRKVNFKKEDFKISKNDYKIKIDLNNDNRTSFYNTTLYDCKAMCECAYCNIACQKVQPDYSCKMFGLPCVVVISIIGGIVLFLTICSMLIAVLQRFIYWFKNKLSGKNYEKIVN